MNLPNEKFCVLPWISLEASPIGTVRPCCLTDDEIVDDSGKKFQLRDADFQNIRSSKYMQHLRQQFLDGEQPQTCRKCWHEERAGRTSKRQHTLQRLKHVIDEQPWTTDAKPLIFLDLKLGNICNLKCRICGSWSSSQYANEELADLPLGQDKKSSYPYQMLRAGSWPRENDSFWNEIAAVTEHIRYIEFTGGEPFMIQEHFDFLQRLVDLGVSANVEIHYNTNGTHFPEHAIDIWQHFRLVEIAFSIDDVAERFEYQRSNARWSEVESNISRFRELRGQHDNLRLQLCCTVNVFNVLYLDDVAQWIAPQRFDFIYWNIMHDAWYFSVATLPDTVKTLAKQKLRSASMYRYFQRDWEGICEFMDRGASTDGFMTRMKIRDLDRKRQQDLASIQPELAQALDYARHD